MTKRYEIVEMVACVQNMARGLKDSESLALAARLADAIEPFCLANSLSFFQAGGAPNGPVSNAL